MARRLLKARVRSEMAAANGTPLEVNKSLTPTSMPADEKLDDNHMRLYAYYTPALEGGAYTVSATQTITAYKGPDAQTRTLQNQTLVKDPGAPGPVPVYNKDKDVKQRFNVVAPQFSLDPALVNSCYPPPGHQDEGRVLPHVVFSDPHVPWLRAAGTTDWATGPIPGGNGDAWKDRNKVPWMALLVCKPEDLRVDTAAAGSIGLDKLDAWTTVARNGAKPPGDGAYEMAVAEYVGLPSRVSTEMHMTDGEKADLASSTQRTRVVFPKKSFVTGVFTADAPGSMGGPETGLAPLNALQLLAHVRHVNTRGMPDADPLANPDAYLSVVVSSMTGNVAETRLTTHIVHLVSIENLDATLQAGIGGTPSDRLAMVSLFSWTYACIPESVDFATTMEALADKAQPLRAPAASFDALDVRIIKETDPAKADALRELKQRLVRGYALTRWRDALGEESMAFTRGPLVPMAPTTTQPPPPPSTHLPGGNEWPATSMTGKNYMILDRKLGLFDMSYASAWSLGRLTAIADGTFTAAMTRLRARTWTAAVSTTLMTVNEITPKRDVVARSAATLATTRAILARDGAAIPGQPVSRLGAAPTTNTRPPQTLHDPHTRALLRANVAAAVRERSTSSATGAVWTGLDGEDKPVDADWAVVSDWVHDALFLARMPAHYLFPDPSFLRADAVAQHPEALRWFGIDETWVDCYVDGALSVSNHLDPQHDSGRVAIKKMINEALAGGGVGGAPLLVPRAGFVLRSAAVKAAPDLRISATRFVLRAGGSDSNGGGGGDSGAGGHGDGSTPADGGNKNTMTWVEDPAYDPLLRYTRLDEFTLLVLFDTPLDRICHVTLTQPPHQTRFALSFGDPEPPDNNTTILSPPPSRMLFKKLYTNPDAAKNESSSSQPPGSWGVLDPKYQLLEKDAQSGFYAAATRTIAADVIAKTAVGQLGKWNADNPETAPYSDDAPDSCVLGMQLNDPCYQLVVRGNTPTGDGDAPESVPARQLWTGGPSPPPTIGSITRTAETAVKMTETSYPIPTAAADTPASPPPALKVPPHNPSLLLPFSRTDRLLLNRALPIPNTTPSPASNLRPPTQWPPADTKDCQFELLLHPDYRPPPPRPIPPYHATQTTVYSPQTILPISPKYLYDLVLAIRRRPGTAQPQLNLTKLFVELPVPDATDPKPPSANFWREPLLEGGTYTTTKLAMAGNQRFVPTLENSLHSTDDGQACVRVTLVPRSGRQDGTMSMGDWKVSGEASVRLGEVRIAGVVDDESTAEIAGGEETVRNLVVGRCFVKMTEVYDDGGEKYSWAVALKSDDADAWAPKGG